MFPLQEQKEKEKAKGVQREREKEHFLPYTLLLRIHVIRNISFSSNSVSSEEPTLVIHKNQLFVGLNLLSSSSETKAKTKIEHSHHQHVI